MTRQTPTPLAVVTRLETLWPSEGSQSQTRIAQITLDVDAVGGPIWVLELLPGQRVKPESLHAMEGRWATKAKTLDEARACLNEATHALVALLEAQAAERQAFIRRIDKATGDRQATLPLGEHDPLDDRP